MSDELENQSRDSENLEKTSKEQDEIIIPEEFKPILADPDIPKDKKDKIIRAVLGLSIGKASSFSGPIPPPELLKGYNEVVKDGAERIVVMAEKQSNHRMQLEDHAIKEELKQSRLGQVFGFILGIVGLVLAAILAILDHEAIAGIFGTTTILGLVTVFVLGKKAQKKDLEDKD
ncbi:MAG TPA: DUF2335 domain-containing protein [bacterium]|nr:DUF2335 domain-containing protein [bacterium]